MSVRCVYYPQPFNATIREVESHDWRPGLTVRDVVPSRLAPDTPLLVYRCAEPLTLDTLLADGETVAVAVRPGAFYVAAAAATAATTASAAVTASWLATTFAAVGGWWGGLSGIAKQLFLSAGLYAAGRLLAQPPGGKRRGDEDSPVYGFGGPGNIRVEGQPIPVLYGLFRYPGTIINEFTRTRTTPPRTDYYALACFGEGPVHSIGGVEADTSRSAPIASGASDFPTGIQFNGNDAANLDGVTVAVRLGTPEQDVCSGPGLPFEATQQRIAQSVVLGGVETTGQDNGVRAFDNSDYTTSTADDHFDAYGASFSFTDDYDAFRCVVTFAQGLYRITLTGNIQSTNFDCALRYIELDGSGNPITTGGPEGDGYVRLPLEERILGTQRHPYSVEFDHPFYDPQTYQHPAGGRALVLDGTNDYASVGTVNVPTALTAGANANAVGVSCWVNFDTLASGSENPIVDWSTATQGFKVSAVVGVLGSPLPVQIVVSIRSGTNWVTHAATVPGGLPTGDWRLVSVSYTLSPKRLRIWIGNSMIYASTSPQTLVSAGSNTLYIGKLQAGSTFTDGRIDELEVINRELTQTDIAVRFATGVGTYLGAVTEHVGLWHFDSDSTTDPTPDDSSARANHLTLTGGASIPSSINGKVTGPPNSSNVVKKSRYKVEIVRVNEESTHTNVQDEATWTELVGIISEEFSYPSIALAAVGAQASEQLNSTVPTVTMLGKWRLVPHWDGLSQSSPTFYESWSRNPAWIALDVILNERYGLGREYTGEDVDVQSFQDLADYCDELIYDAQGEFEATADWTDITYTGASGVGTLTIQFEEAAYETLRWIVGDYVALTGVPIPTSTVDINSATPGGYLISAMDPALFTVTVDVSLSADPWTSGTLLSTDISPAAVEGTAEGREPRYFFDGAFDTENSVWDGLMAILATARAVPIREGKRIRVKYEHPRESVDIIGQGSIVAGSWEVTYGGRANRANSLMVEFQDEDQNYDRSTATLDHPSVQNATSLDVLRRETISLFGTCRRSQALRQAAFLLNCNEELKREGRFVAAIDALALEVGDVLTVSHDVSGWGVSGRIYANDSTTSIKLGRTVTLAPATTYTLHVRNKATGLYEGQTVNSAAGTYALGAAITVSSAFSFIPERDAVFLLSVEGAEMQVQVTGISLTQNLQREVAWLEYNPDVYDDDWFGGISAAEIDSLPASSGLIMPGNSTGVDVAERVVRGPGDNYETHLQVSWENDDDSAEFVESTALWLSIDGGSFVEVAIVGGKATGADVKVDRLAAGSVATVAVQPRTSRGVRRRPEACANGSTVMLGIALPPEAPTAIVARMEGDLAVYAVTAADSTALHEIRRGGWILGDHVTTMDPARVNSVPIPSWASVFGPNAPNLYVRALGSSGFYSDFALLNDTLAPAGARTIPTAITASNENWATYADGWQTDTAPPVDDPVLDGFEVVDDAVHGDYLQFAGSALEATYETGYAASAIAVPIRAYVEAWWDAEQDHPLPIDDWTWGIGDPSYSRWTMEGPMTVLAGESANCTLKVQIRVDDSGVGTLSNWQDLVSGSVYSLADAQFRLVATRPSTDYNVRIRRFVTRIRQQAFAATDTY